MIKMNEKFHNYLFDTSIYYLFLESLVLIPFHFFTLKSKEYSFQLYMFLIYKNMKHVC